MEADKYPGIYIEGPSPIQLIEDLKNQVRWYCIHLGHFLVGVFVFLYAAFNRTSSTEKKEQKIKQALNEFSEFEEIISNIPLSRT